MRSSRPHPPLLAAVALALTAGVCGGPVVADDGAAEPAPVGERAPAEAAPAQAPAQPAAEAAARAGSRPADGDDASAEQATAPASEVPQEPAASADEPPPPDPFATPRAIREAARAQAQARGGGPTGSAPLGLTPRRLPPLVVRATLRVTGRPPGAVLQVGERTTLVRPGQRLSVALPDGGPPLTLEVLGIAGGAVTVRVDGEPAPRIVR